MVVQGTASFGIVLMTDKRVGYGPMSKVSAASLLSTLLTHFDAALATHPSFDVLFFNASNLFSQ